MLPSSTRRISDFLAAVYRIQGVAELSATIVRELPRIVEGDNAMIGQHDATQRAMGAIVLTRPFAQNQFLPEAVDKGLLSTHPFWEEILNAKRPVKVLSEMAPGARWTENPFYQEILRHDGVRDHINVEFGKSAAAFMSVGVVRSKVGFSAVEREVLRTLRPHFVQAFENARIADSLGLAGRPGGAQACVAELDLRGCWLDSAARERFESMFGGSRSSLAARLDRWILAEVDRRNRGFADAGCAPLRVGVGNRFLECVLTRDFGRGRYRLVHWFTDDLVGNHLIRLTPRETEVLHWLREGKGNGEIAVILGMRVDTVKFHLKSIYRKLGVENRTAAATHDFQI